MNVWQQLLASRKFWIAATALVLAIASALGLDEAKAGKVMSAIVALAGVLMGAISYEDGQQKRADPNADNQKPNTGGTPVPPVNDSGETPGKVG